MPNFQVPYLPHIITNDSRLGQALQAIQDAINNIASQTAASAAGPQGTSPSPASLTVTAAQGVFDIAITDNAPIQRGIEYFLEYSLTASFNQPTVIHLGTTRNHRVFLGNQILYWRAYSQYGPASAPSQPVYFGSANNPTPVAGGGTITGPAPLASNGSGTASTNGLQGGAGYGHNPTRGTPSL